MTDADVCIRCNGVVLPEHARGSNRGQRHAATGSFSRADGPLHAACAEAWRYEPEAPTVVDRAFVFLDGVRLRWT